MKTKQLHGAMEFFAAIHTIQGVFDEFKGTDLWDPKSEKLIGQILRTFEPRLNKILINSEAQIPLFNIANLYSIQSKWLVDNQGSEEEAAEKLANKIARLYDLMGFEVEQVS